jgi:ATP-dependent RNA helicase SUPV3L1/SUV3
VGEILHKLGFRLERVPMARAEEERVGGTAADEGAAPAEATTPASNPGGEADAGIESAANTVASEPAEGARPDADAQGEAKSDDIASSEAAEAVTVEPRRERGPEKGHGKAASEFKLDEIWRPRRQGRHADRARRRFAGPAEPAKDEARPRRAGKEGRHGDGRPKEGRQQHTRHDRHDRRPERRQGQGPPGRKDDRPQRPFRHSASPAPKTGIDPDSPFAALSSLKAALEKQNQE